MQRSVLTTAFLNHDCFFFLSLLTLFESMSPEAVGVFHQEVVAPYMTLLVVGAAIVLVEFQKRAIDCLTGGIAAFQGSIIFSQSFKLNQELPHVWIFIWFKISDKPIINGNNAI